jgi:hypothetical protein
LKFLLKVLLLLIEQTFSIFLNYDKIPVLY